MCGSPFPRPVCSLAPAAGTPGPQNALSPSQAPHSPDKQTQEYKKQCPGKRAGPRNTCEDDTFIYTYFLQFIHFRNMHDADMEVRKYQYTRPEDLYSEHTQGLNCS